MSRSVTEHVAPEGRRARKQRETRARIADAAMRLFLERGYEATTLDDVAEAADVSRRSLFDYFPTKEDVLFAGQDDFVPALVAELRQRPEDEPWPVLVEHALTRAVAAAATPESFAIDALVRRTPALQPRRQLKYLHLEQAIAGVLAERVAGDGRARRRAEMLAAVVVAGFRLATSDPEEAAARAAERDVQRSVARDFRGFWGALRDFGEAGLAPRRPPAPARRLHPRRGKGGV
jgi:AcrR family transcriptional regulator